LPGSTQVSDRCLADDIAMTHQWYTTHTDGLFAVWKEEITMSVVLEKPALLTGADLLEMGDIGPSELVEGEVIPMSPTQAEHGMLEALLTAVLYAFVTNRRLGWVVSGEVGFYTRRSPDTVRAVDVAFISRLRQLRRPSAFLDIAPELVVEIVCPSDRWDSIRKKIAEYFGAGVDRVWIVEPGQRKVLVFRAPTELTELGEGDILRGEGVLDGFELPLRELFGEEFTEETAS
jgi:Uma2 family endonuclease